VLAEIGLLSSSNKCIFFVELMDEMCNTTLSGIHRKPKRISRNTKSLSTERLRFFLIPLSIYDAKHSSLEDRWITVGKDRNDIALVVVHSFRESDTQTASIRIISTRRATKNEIKQYSKR